MCLYSDRIALVATTQSTSDRVYIEDLARRLDPTRAVHTIRRWINEGLLPAT
jgi:hypothetical protein